MASTYTTNAGIELIATGEQSGTWGDTTNTNLQIIDRLTNGVGAISLSGTTHTLTTSDGALSDGQYKVLVFGGSPSGTNTVTITPNTAQHVYVVKNNSGQSIVLTQGSGGNVTVANGKSAIVYADGAGASAAVVNITDTFAMSNVTITGGSITGITDLAVADGGTGVSTVPTNGQLLIGNGSGYTVATLTAGTGTSISNGSGSITISATGSGGTVTSVSGTGTVNGLTLTGTVTTSGSLTLGGTLAISNADWSGTDLSVANGGTGASSFTANNVLLGNGTSAFQTVAPGTSGNVLTSNGTTWTSAAPAGGGGGAYDFVASGAISNGDLVKINSDGTVSVLSALTSGPTVFESASSVYLSAAYDSTNGKVVIAYQDAGNSSYGTAVVGTVSGTSISFGTPVVFESANSLFISVAYDSTNGKVVIAYTDGGNSSYGTAIVGTVSGTSISFGTPVVFESATSFYSSVSYDSTNGKVVIAYRDGGNSNYGTAIVGTVSGTSISFGTPAVFESALSNFISSAYDSTNGKVVIAYRDVGNSSYGTAVVGTVSGTSISFGTPVVFESAATEYISVAYDSINGKVVIAYQDTGNSSLGTAVVGTVSGTSISFGTPVVFGSGTSAYMSAAYDSTNGKVVIAYRDSGNSSYGIAVVGTVIGTSIGFGAPVVFNSAATEYSSVAYDSTNGKVVIAYRDAGNSSYGTAGVFDFEFLNWIGISSENIADTATGSINLLGGVNEGQTGLTAGELYYIQDDATISRIPTFTGREVGRAISSTKLLITKGTIYG